MSLGTRSISATSTLPFQSFFHHPSCHTVCLLICSDNNSSLFVFIFVVEMFKLCGLLNQSTRLGSNVSQLFCRRTRLKLIAYSTRAHSQEPSSIPLTQVLHGRGPRIKRLPLFVARHTWNITIAGTNRLRAWDRVNLTLRLTVKRKVDIKDKGETQNGVRAGRLAYGGHVREPLPGSMNTAVPHIPLYMQSTWSHSVHALHICSSWRLVVCWTALS